jgi:hypothetical protein
MALGKFTAGPYTASHTPAGGSPAAIGLTEDGWRVRLRLLGEEISRSDAYGMSLLDSVYQGARAVATCTFIEWDTDELAMAMPWSAWLPVGTTKLIVVNTAGPIGRLASDKAGSLVLTAQANTPAATNGPATLTMGKLIAMPNQDIDVYMGPGHRKFAMNFDLLLYLSTSDYILYSGT